MKRQWLLSEPMGINDSLKILFFNSKHIFLDSITLAPTTVLKLHFRRDAEKRAIGPWDIYLKLLSVPHGLLIATNYQEVVPIHFMV